MIVIKSTLEGDPEYFVKVSNIGDDIWDTDIKKAKQFDKKESAAKAFKKMYPVDTKGAANSMKITYMSI